MPNDKYIFDIIKAYFVFLCFSPKDSDVLYDQRVFYCAFTTHQEPENVGL